MLTFSKLETLNYAFGTAALVWQSLGKWTRGLSLILQVNANSSVYTNTAISYLANPAFMAALGGTIDLASATQLEFSINEDTGSEFPTPDVAFHLLLRHRF